MSTRCRIGIEHEDGWIESVYSHWDGGGWWVAPILSTAYRETRKIKRLLSHKDISSLGVNVGRKHPFNDCDNYEEYKKLYGDMTTFYYRDRGDVNVATNLVPTCTKFVELTDKTGGEYAYLWTYSKEWLVCDLSKKSRRFVPMAAFLAEYWEITPKYKEIYDKLYKRFEKRLKR